MYKEIKGVLRCNEMRERELRSLIGFVINKRALASIYKGKFFSYKCLSEENF